MTVHPNDRDWDHLDALVDVDPIALRDTAWRLATALTAAERRADEAEVRIKAARELLARWVDEYGHPVYQGNGWAEGVRDAAREALRALNGT